MTAACYLRKSNEEGEKHEDAKSVAQQLAGCRKFAAERGWTIADEHVYVDDGISGGEFERRPGFARLMSAITAPTAPFSVLIVADESRIGRDAIRTMMAVQQIVDAGVRIYGYLDNREIRLDGDSDEITEFVRAWSASQHKKVTAKKVYRTHQQLAEKGFTTGGRCYGYDRVREGAGVRLVVNEREAAVVCRIFELTAEGRGLKTIAKLLNAEGVPSPRGNGWAPSAIQPMLRRSVYRGVMEWGQTHRAWTKGTQRRSKTPRNGDVVTVERPELRIVPEQLWKAAHARIERTAQTYAAFRCSGGARPGTLNGRPEAGLVSKHLLSGFLRCSECGSNMVVVSRARVKGGKPTLYYVCGRYHQRGPKCCLNRHSVPYSAITSAIIDRFSSRFLTLDVLKKFAEDERAQIESGAIAAERAGLTADVRRLDAEIQRLVDTVAEGAGSIPALADAMKRKQTARDNAVARIKQLEEIERQGESERLTIDALIAEGEDGTIVNLEEILHGDPVKARAELRQLLRTPITITPVETADGVAFEYHGEARLDPILSGRIAVEPKPVGVSIGLVPKGGLEPPHPCGH